MKNLSYITTLVPPSFKNIWINFLLSTKVKYRRIQRRTHCSLHWGNSSNIKCKVTQRWVDSKIMNDEWNLCCIILKPMTPTCYSFIEEVVEGLLLWRQVRCVRCERRSIVYRRGGRTRHRPLLWRSAWWCLTAAQIWWQTLKQYNQNIHFWSIYYHSNTNIAKKFLISNKQ